MSEAAETTLYQRLGGHEGIAAVVRIFYKRVLEDHAVRAYFNNTDMEKLMEHQTVFVSFATGGPDFYTGQSLTQSHEGLNIASEHFDAVIGHLGESLKEGGVSQEDAGQVLSRLLPLKSRIVGQTGKE